MTMSGIPLNNAQEIKEQIKIKHTIRYNKSGERNR